MHVLKQYFQANMQYAIFGLYQILTPALVMTFSCYSALEIVCAIAIFQLLIVAGFESNPEQPYTI